MDSSLFLTFFLFLADHFRIKYLIFAGRWAHTPAPQCFLTRLFSDKMKVVIKLLLTLLFAGSMSVLSAQEKQESFNADSLYAKARDYQKGENGVLMDKEKARELLILLADYGDVRAQNDLSGDESIPADRRLKWLRNAAEKRFLPAMMWIGECYLQGYLGLQVDKEQSHYWARLCAETGDGVALFCYACDFLDGTGTPKNVEEGLKWLNASADKGYIPAVKMLAGMYKTGQDVYKNYDKYFTYMKRGAELGDAACQFELGSEMFHSEGGEKYEDPGQALEWFKKAAAQKCCPAYYYMGLYYEKSDGFFGIEEDPKTALDWYRKGAECNHARCYFRIYEVLRWNSELAVSKNEMMEAIAKAAELGLKDAQAEQASLKYFGLCPEDERGEGIRTLVALAEEGVLRAKAILGSFYYSGLGTKRDKKKGEQLLLEAAHGGDETALRLAKEYKLVSKDIKHKIL